MLYSDLMIDLETLGVDHGSVITQIGLCAFNAGDDPDSPVESTSFCVDIAMSLDLGFKVQGNTILWWMRQSDEARAAFIDSQANALTPHMALSRLQEFWLTSIHHPDGRVWGNGPTFDIALLEQYYQRCGLAIPWSYKNVRCLRTLASLRDPHAQLRPSPSVAHEGEADAIAQARWVQAMLRGLSWNRNL